MASPPALEKHPGVDDWLCIESTGQVLVRTGKVDIGQRISTALALIVAEELDVDFERVRVAGAETGASPDEGYTSGSNSMEESGSALRLAAATVRRRLLELAAEALAVEPSSLEVIDGLVRSRQANRSITYWELAGNRALGVAIDPHVTLKDPGDYRTIGEPIVPLGLRDLVMGSAQFVHDMSLPGMLHARVVRPPHYHARLSRLGDTLQDSLGDAMLVRDGSFLAVADRDEYRAVTLVSRVQAAATWVSESELDTGDVYQRLLHNPRISLPVVDGTPRDEPLGEPTPPPTDAATTLSARFERPYQMHASLGPSAALAIYENGKLRVWTHSQGIYPLRDSIAEALGMGSGDVTLIHRPGPGCYGHNGADDAALDAALVAKAIPATPILLKWSRDDEHAWEPYGPSMVVQVEASLDGEGRVSSWRHESYSDTHMGRPRPGPDGIGPARLLATGHLGEPRPTPVPRPNMATHGGMHRNGDPLYAFPRRRIVKHLVRDLPLRTSTLRTLGAYANVFAIESFMDELALAAGADPLAFRLRHLADPQAHEVLQTAADALGWRRGARAPGIGQGLAFARYKNSKTYAAVAMEVQVDDAAVVHLRRAVIAADAGQVVDRDGLACQLEGGMLQAASWTLYEQVTFDARGITSRDWDGYPILGFDNVPLIETLIMDRPGKPYLGAGEATPGPTAAAIANAVFDAAGLRIRRLPLTPDTIRAAALA
jgi:CO/xanthine dehydrogenase Mo-binding subunit